MPVVELVWGVRGDVWEGTCEFGKGGGADAVDDVDGELDEEDDEEEGWHR